MAERSPGVIAIGTDSRRVHSIASTHARTDRRPVPASWVEDQSSCEVESFGSQGAVRRGNMVLVCVPQSGWARPAAVR